MTALVFLSGGIDSTVLAATIAQHPYQHGVKPEGPLHLFTAVEGSSVAKKRKELGPLVRWLKSLATAWDEVTWTIEETELIPSPQYEMPAGGHHPYPLLTGYAPDRDSSPHSMGLHMWMASKAVNILGQEAVPPYGPRKAYWGFQEDGPYWGRRDDGYGSRSNDASPEWVAALNALMGATEVRVRFEAPYLHSMVDKEQIVSIGQALQVPWEMTSSCMYGWSPYGCGICHQCVRRGQVFASKGISV